MKETEKAVISMLTATIGLSYQGGPNNFGRIVGISTLTILSAIALAIGVIRCGGNAEDEETERYFLIQEKAVMASILHEFHSRLRPTHSEEGLPFNRVPKYLYDSFLYPETSEGKANFTLISQQLSNKYNVQLENDGSRFEAYDMTTGDNLGIYKQKDWNTIHALVRDCNEWIKAEGRLACEFDGGSDYGMKPYTTVLFNVAYLEYQSQKLGYSDGEYKLAENDEPVIVLDVDSLMSRNAIARVVCYQFLVRTSSLLVEHFEKSGQTPPTDNWGWSALGPDDLNQYYVEQRGTWQQFMNRACKVQINWAKTSFEILSTATEERIDYPHDEELIEEALKELNCYREKVDFTQHFMVENYPIFLLSILRLYNVNLQIDEASGKVVIAPGPTDPEAFFDIVAECTFVNDPSDTEYLKEHLTSWLEADPTKP